MDHRKFAKEHWHIKSIKKLTWLYRYGVYLDAQDKAVNAGTIMDFAHIDCIMYSPLLFTKIWVSTQMNDWIKCQWPNLFDIFGDFGLSVFTYVCKIVNDEIEKKTGSQYDYSIVFSRSLRFKILARDHYKCTVCGRSASDGVILQVDHIVPKSKGGKATLDNGATLCRDCNLGKGNNIY